MDERGFLEQEINWHRAKLVTVVGLLPEPQPGQGPDYLVELPSGETVITSECRLRPTLIGELLRLSPQEKSDGER